MKKSIIGAAILAVCAFICVLIFTTKNQDVAVIKPENREIKNEIEISGKVQAKNTFTVTNTETAEIKYVYVKLGDTVKKGDTLYTLDDDGLEEQLEELKSLQTNATDTTEASKILEKAQQGMDYSAFNTAIEEAKAEQAALVATTTTNQISAQIAQIEKQLEAKKVKSVIDGTVVTIGVKKGEIVVAGQQSATIADVENKYVTAYVMQQDYNNVTEGTEVTLQDEQTGLCLTGIVTYKDYLAKETAETDAVSQYKIEIMPNETIGNAIGSSVSVFICIEKRESTLSLPLTCVLKDNESTYVYIREKGKIKKRTIVTGLRDDNYIEVLNGVDENTSVLSDPSEYTKGEE